MRAELPGQPHRCLDPGRTPLAQGGQSPLSPGKPGKAAARQGCSPSFLRKQKLTGALPFLSQKVGLSLRKLIGSVDSILPSLPASSRTEVSVLVSDRASGSPSPPPAPAEFTREGHSPLGSLVAACRASAGALTARLSLFHEGMSGRPGPWPAS